MAHVETNWPELGENAIAQRNRVNETAIKTPFCFAHSKKKSRADISIKCIGMMSVLTPPHHFQLRTSEGLAIESRRHNHYFRNAENSTGKK
jgi:hypothetical protein